VSPQPSLLQPAILASLCTLWAPASKNLGGSLMDSLQVCRQVSALGSGAQNWTQQPSSLKSFFAMLLSS